mmetsp:Transcript_106967/g.190191  ORF Transcript_106967/g.190191 Transcript_106967/m.190191 type:complete len:880 (-) Transcript_106967:93-2732(-)
MDQPLTEPEPDGESSEREDTFAGESSIDEEDEDVNSNSDCEEKPCDDKKPAVEHVEEKDATCEGPACDTTTDQDSTDGRGHDSMEDSEPQDDGLKKETAAEPQEPKKTRSGLWMMHRGALTTLRLRWVARRRRLSEAARREDAGGGDLLMSDDEEDSQSFDDGEPGSSDLASRSLSESWQVVDHEGTVVAEENGQTDTEPSAGGSVEAKIERMLTWMLAPAIHGIPKLGVLGAEGRAAELLGEHGRDVEAAVKEVVAGSERTVSALVLNFCLERIPVLGCPTVLLRTTWGNLRSILIIAALYGHDLESPRVQHEALLCLVPPGDDKELAAAALKQQNASDGVSPNILVSSTAQQVARMMIKGALRRATGFQAAVDCFELASLLYSSVGDELEDEDGFVHVTATPSSAARDLFRKKSIASCALLWCSLPFLVIGMAAPTLLTAGRILPRILELVQTSSQRLPQGYLRSVPALLLFFTGPCLAVKWLRPKLPTRKKRETFLQNLLGQHNVGRWERFQDALEEAWPQIVTSMVFLLHALMPAISTFSSLSVVLGALGSGDLDYGWQGWDLMSRLACASLGFYSLSAVLILQLQSRFPEADSADAALSLRASMRSLLVARSAARSLCFLAAWAYLLLLLDSLADRLWRLPVFFRGQIGVPSELWWGREGTPLGMIGPLAWMLGAPATSHPLESEKSMAFCLHLLSVISQQRLVELLARREVLLRLIGAERMMASTICLLFKGVAVACSPSKSANPIAEFLTRVAPPPVCCIAIVAMRDQAWLLGTAVILAPKLTSFLNTSLCFTLGLTVGAYASHAILLVWYTYRADLDSPALRLAMLVPGGVSNQAKGLLRGVLAGAQRRAVQMMAMGIIQRALRWITGAGR